MEILKLSNNTKEIPIKTFDENFWFMPNDMVTLSRSIEISLIPMLDKKITLPKSLKLRIQGCSIGRYSNNMMTYKAHITLKEMNRVFKDLPTDEKYVINDVIDEIEFHDCDFDPPQGTLYNITNHEGIIQISATFKTVEDL